MTWPAGILTAGGNGGTSVGTVAVTPGDALPLVVGAAGANEDWFASAGVGHGGYGGGGNSGNFSDYGPGTGGGGGSFLFAPNGSLLLAAGGGGGSADGKGGGKGGTATSPGTNGANGTSGAAGGAGATSSGDGAGGSGGGSAGTGQSTGPTSLAQGGRGGNGWQAGGGGGGGYYAGGGGGGNSVAGVEYSAGGGGGVGYAAGTVTSVSGTVGNVSGNGSIVLTWTAPAAQTIASFTPPTSPAAVGTSQTLHATGGASGVPVTFSADGTTTNNACSVSGSTVSFRHVGTCVIDANEEGDGYYGAAAEVQRSVTVTQGLSVTTLSLTPTSMVAGVTSVPGTTNGTGTVTFYVDGSVVGTADLSGGTATLDYAVPTGQEKVVEADFPGDTDLAASSLGFVQTNPVLEAGVTSAEPEHNGWYRTDVKITFTCIAGTAPLTTSCPSRVLLDTDGAAQRVIRKITAADGSWDRVVRHVSIDKVKPHVRIKGVKAGAVYHSSLPTITCVVHDALSGPDGCKIHRHKVGRQVTIKAIGFDKARNRTVKKITVTLKP